MTEDPDGFHFIVKTPRMTQHARDRCAEMGISTKVAKRISRCAETHYPGNPSEQGDCQIALWSGDQRYAVVQSYEVPPSIITVLFRNEVAYVRQGPTFVPGHYGSESAINET